MATMKLLMVAGGGGGGTAGASQGGGGGGGGGCYYNASFSIISNTYLISIGAGGGAGANGGNTTFGYNYATGGGAGGAYNNNGISVTTYLANGGGAGSNTKTGGTSSTGYAGGNSTASHAGGGGGAGGAGGVSSEVTGGGAGGAGLTCDITGTSLVYGEGGGGGYGGTTTGVGGRGATGAGVVGSGMANRGGGGGGNYNNYGTGSGGSGVVIISYITSEWGTCTGGTITTNGIYTVHTFTSAGTFTVVSQIKKLASVTPLEGISIDTTSTGANGATNSDTLTWSHTVGSGTDRVLVIFIPISQAITVSSVSYGGQALTLFGGIANGTPKAYMYYLTNPSVGAANCSIVFNTSIQYLYAGAASFFGVEQSTAPISNISTAADTAQNRNLSIYVPFEDSWVLECMGDGGSVNSPASGQTRVTYDNRISSYDSVVGTGTVTQSWTGTSSQAFAWVGGCLKASRRHFKGINGITGTTVKKIGGIGNL